jgi:pilus assembly protein TadC
MILTVTVICLLATGAYLGSAPQSNLNDLLAKLRNHLKVRHLTTAPEPIKVPGVLSADLTTLLPNYQSSSAIASIILLPLPLSALYAVIELMLSNWSLAIAGAVLVWLTIIVLILAFLHLIAGALRSHLEHELQAVLNLILHQLDRGRSLTRAFNSVADSAPRVWRPFLHELAGKLGHGTPIREALEELSQSIGSSRISEVFFLLSESNSTQTTKNTIALLLRQEMSNQRNRMIETVERNTQLIWIPVSIATIVPGVLLLLIPLIHSMNILASS